MQDGTRGQAVSVGALLGIKTRTRKLISEQLVTPGSPGYRIAKRIWGNAFRADLRVQLEPEMRATFEPELRGRLEAELRTQLEPELHAVWEERFWAQHLTRDLPPAQLSVDDFAATAVFFERLDDTDIEEIRRVVSVQPEHGWLADDDSGNARRVLLHLGVWNGVPGVTEKTGLSAVNPPEDVHAMGRGPLAAGGALYEADMIAAALISAGVDPATLGRVLDFGCSSGRAVRALQAAYPEVAWLGCDPNEPAITWAQANLPGIEFFRSGDRPPLPLADGSLDAAYAISIWSHFEPALGLEWFAEMHRLIRPGGHLVFTTHGPASVEYYLSRNLRTWQQSGEIAKDLYTRGNWYAAEFGEAGDWGVTNPDWGTAFLEPEWLLGELCPQWHVVEFATARNCDNQDLYVLQRV